MPRPPRSLLRATLLGAALALAAPALAKPSGARDAAGAWDMALDNSHRRCRIILGPEPAETGRSLRVPATCRRALPILRDAGFWSAEDSRVSILDRVGRPLLHFAGEDEGIMVARTEGGESYRLEQKERMRLAASAAPLAPAPLVPQRTWVDPAKAPGAETLPGTYSVDRYQERDVCQVALTPMMLSAAGVVRYELRLLEGCRDAGLAAFDPVSWRYEAGRLTLTARRGHEVDLVSEREGSWRRDPEVGATLILRRTASP